MFFWNSLVVSNSFWLCRLQHARLRCPSLSPRVCSNSCPLSWWCDLTFSSSVAHFSSYPQSFPESFLMCRLFVSGGQRIGASASASVLPMNIQGWFPLRFTGLLSLLFKWCSKVFSSTTIWKIISSALSLLYGPVLTSVLNYLKNCSFDYTDFCQQSDVSVF